MGYQKKKGILRSATPQESCTRTPFTDTYASHVNEAGTRDDHHRQERQEIIVHKTWLNIS